MELIDLHVHSTFSDGTYTPEELVIEAKEKNLKAFALTDHDTVAGIEEALKYGKDYNIEVIPGIEISCSYTTTIGKEKEIHIVGLFIDYKNEEFLSSIGNQVEIRNTRNDKVIKKMNEYGFPITLTELHEMFGTDTIITRAHFASWLTKKGYVKDNQQAFSKYLQDGKPFCIPRERITPEKAVRLINNAGGVAILAHPILYDLGEKELNLLCSKLKKAGLVGIEAIYSTYRNGDEILVRRLAKANGLLISGGSDFHGGNKPYIHLGIGRGNLKIPYEILTNLKVERNL